jgi:hypothetical protein
MLSQVDVFTGGACWQVLFVFIAQLAYVIMSMFWTEQIDTFRTTTSAPSTISKNVLKWKEVGSDQTFTGTEIKNELLAAALLKQVEFNQKEWDKFQVQEVSSDSYIMIKAATATSSRYFKPTDNATSTGTEMKLKPPKSAPKKRKVPAQDPISTKYLVREMKPTRTSLKPKEHVLCITDSGLGECEIEKGIKPSEGNSGGYLVKWLWHENTDFINSQHTINEQDIRYVYVLVKDGTCLHQDPKWRSALEIVVRSSSYPPSSRPPPSTLSSPGRKMF